VPASGAIDAGLMQGALHHLELVGPRTKLAELDLHLGIERPDALLPFLGKPKPLKRLEPPNP
jgi:hypothetical protein